MIYSPEELEEMETLISGHCCDCKVDKGDLRVWICRVAGGVTIERRINGVWKEVEGGCMETYK